MHEYPKCTKAEYAFAIYGNFPHCTGELRTENGMLTYEGDGYTVSSEYSVHDTGILSRTDTVKNLSDNPIDIRSALSRFTFDGGEYEVYTQYSAWTGESQGAWQLLNTEICGHSESVRSNSGMAPFVAIYNLQNRRGYAFHIMADSLWKFAVRKNYLLPTGKNISVELGINDTAFSYVLNKGESLTLPTILCYEFRDKTDMEAYRLHRYCNDTLPARSLPVIYNSWLSKFDTISYDILSVQLERAARLGVEYFVIDAGWFGEPFKWFDSVGDWEECRTASMRGRMLEFADKVRTSGLKFGIWFEIERAAAAAKSVAAYPQYYIKEGNNYFVNFADPEACDYIFSVLSSQIKRYGVEFIKFDFNAELTYDILGHSFIEWFNGYNSFIRRLNTEHSNVYLENCASGGMRMSLSNLKGFDSFWTSDNHSLYTQLRIFKDTLLRMPSRALESWLTVRTVTDFKPVYTGEYTEKTLCSGDASWGHIEAVHNSFMKGAMLGGPLGISCDLTELSETAIEDLADFIAEFKRDRNFWLNSECHILTDTPSVLVLQFCDREYKRIKLCCFAYEIEQHSIRVYPVCEKRAAYTLANNTKMSGKEIDSIGIEMPINGRFEAAFTELNTMQ